MDVLGQRLPDGILGDMNPASEMRPKDEKTHGGEKRPRTQTHTQTTIKQYEA